MVKIFQKTKQKNSVTNEKTEQMENGLNEHVSKEV